jgi:translation initiation factor IF-3
VPEVRLVGEDGKQIGVVKTPDALRYAQERDLDLVEVAPEARPPVCRVLDYSKYKYEQAQKLKAARKHQQQITIREIKFRPKIAQNDYDTKKGHVTRFLLGKDKVKITIMFRGREVTHPERGTALLDKLSGELSEIAVIEQSPLQDGRNMTMMLAPSKAVLAGEIDKNGARTSTDAGAEADDGGASTEAADAPQDGGTPTEAAAAPTEDAGAPTEAAAAPTEDDAAPTEDAADPTEDAAAPTEAAADPTEDAAAPTEAAAAPDDDAASPEAAANGDGPSGAGADEPAPAPSDAAA